MSLLWAASSALWHTMSGGSPQLQLAVLQRSQNLWMLKRPYRVRLAALRLSSRHRQCNSGRILGAAALHSKVMFCLLRAGTWHDVVHCYCLPRPQLLCQLPTCCAAVHEALLQHNKATLDRGKLQQNCAIDAAGRHDYTGGDEPLAGVSASQLARDLACLIRQVHPTSAQEAAALEALAQGIAEEDATAVRTLAAILSDPGELASSGEQHQQAGLQGESGMQAALSLVSHAFGPMLCTSVTPSSAASSMLLTFACAARTGAMVIVKACGSVACCMAHGRRGEK